MYYEASRMGRKLYPDETGDARKILAVEPGIRVATLEPCPDEIADRDLDSAQFFGPDADEQAAQWLIRRGCSPPEATRIVGTARKLLLGQSTGTGPTTMERVLGRPLG